MKIYSLYILCILTLYICPVNAQSSTSDEIANMKRKTYEHVEELYSALSEYLKSSRGEDRQDIINELTTYIETETSTYIMDYNPNNTLYNQPLPFYFYLQNLLELYENDPQKHNLHFVPENIRVNLHDNEDYVYEAVYNLYIIRSGINTEPDTLSAKQSSLYFRIDKKGDKKKIDKIKGKIIQISPLRVLDFKSNSGQNETVSSKYIFHINKTNKSTITVSTGYASENISFFCDSYREYTDYRGNTYRDNIPLNYTSNANWLEIRQDSRGFVINIRHNFSGDIRIAKISIVNIEGVAVGTVTCRQQAEPSYDCPSWLKNNNDSYSALLGISYVYSPKAQIGLSFSCLFSKYIELGGIIGLSPNIFKNSNNYNNSYEKAGDNYYKYLSDHSFSEYDPKYDPYGEAKQRNGVFYGMATFTVYPNDIFGIEVGGGYVLRNSNLVLNPAYDMMITEKEPGKVEAFYTPNEYKAYFKQPDKHGLLLSIGLNHLIHINNWENMIKVGAGYRFSPMIDDVAGFYVSLGILYY